MFQRDNHFTLQKQILNQIAVCEDLYDKHYDVDDPELPTGKQVFALLMSHINEADKKTEERSQREMADLEKNQKKIWSEILTKFHRALPSDLEAKAQAQIGDELHKLEPMLDEWLNTKKGKEEKQQDTEEVKRRGWKPE